MYHIFFAEDEPWALITLKNLIDYRKYGFAICGEAEDGLTAWERIARACPDLVVADIRMPGLDGITLLRRIRENRLDTEVLFISGYSEFEYAQAAIEYGCLGYLLKPVDGEELVKYLEKVKRKLSEKHGSSKNKETNYLSENTLVQRMLVYIQENYAEMTLEKLAQQFCMSRCYVSSLIKKNTGKSYNEHLLEARTRKAQELLRLTNASLHEVARKVGYSDYSHFTRVFKKATGISPSAYRRNI